MVTKANRPTVHDMRAMKTRGEKISMLYVTTLEEAAAADAAGIHMLSIESRFFTPEMREHYQLEQLWNKGNVVVKVI